MPMMPSFFNRAIDFSHHSSNTSLLITNLAFFSRQFTDYRLSLTCPSLSCWL